MNINIELGDIEDKALALAQTSPDDVRAMDDAQLAEYLRQAGPLQQAFHDAAERLMRLARPIDEGLFVARNREIEIDQNRNPR